MNLLPFSQFSQKKFQGSRKGLVPLKISEIVGAETLSNSFFLSNMTRPHEPVAIFTIFTKKISRHQKGTGALKNFRNFGSRNLVKIFFPFKYD